MKQIIRKSFARWIILAVLLRLGGNPVFAELFHKPPYLMYTGSNTAMRVLWQLNSTADCSIDWGEDIQYSTGNAQTSEYGDDHQHTFLIQELVPNSKYYYRVTAGEEVYTGSFRTASDTGAVKITFFAYGDTRSNPEDHDLVAASVVDVFTRNDELQTFILNTGDLVRDGDEELYWDEQLFSSQYTHLREMFANLPYQACWGNHDGVGPLFGKYFPYPFVADHYWSFDYGPAHFLVLDQLHAFKPGSGQMIWLENDLAATKKKWKFICLHRPGWSADTEHENDFNVQEYIQPICEEYGVPIVFGGHNHYYARTLVNGITYLTLGGGGANLREPNMEYPYVVAGKKTLHFCQVEIDDDVLDATIIAPDGSVVDSFSVDLFNAYANRVRVNKIFLQAGIDTLVISARAVNHGEHQVELNAVIMSLDTLFQDSLALYDDGFHFDGTAGDGLYANSILTPGIENTFRVRVRTVDIDKNTQSVAYTNHNFTTCGPVVLEDIEYSASGAEPNPGDSVSFKLSLRNNGHVMPVTKVTAALVNLDSLATVTAGPQIYDDIPPGGVKESHDEYTFQVSENCPDSTVIPFQIEIMSDSAVYWIEPFSIRVVSPTGVVRSEQNDPEGFILCQNFPNPFNSSTNIKFILDKAGHTAIQIFNIEGQVVESLMDKYMDAGIYHIKFHAENYESGLYFCRIRSRSKTNTMKIILMK